MIKIIKQALAGLITEAEAHEQLETLGVHGAFDDNGYVGYDYRNQEWLEVADA